MCIESLFRKLFIRIWYHESMLYVIYALKKEEEKKETQLLLFRSMSVFDYTHKMGI